MLICERGARPGGGLLPVRGEDDEREGTLRALLVSLPGRVISGRLLPEALALIGARFGCVHPPGPGTEIAEVTGMEEEQLALGVEHDQPHDAALDDGQAIIG
jgi:hypothetical protein